MSIMFLQGLEKHKLRSHAQGCFPPHSSPLEAQPLRSPDVAIPWVLLPAEPPGWPRAPASWMAAGAQERCEQLPSGQAWFWVTRTRARDLRPSHLSTCAGRAGGYQSSRCCEVAPESISLPLEGMRDRCGLGDYQGHPQDVGMRHCP